MEYYSQEGYFYFRDDTPPEIRKAINACKGQYLRVFYGNPETGKAWLEEYGVIGRLSRTTGPIKVALLVPAGNRYGDVIHTPSVVRIDLKRRGKVETVYRHPNFHLPDLKIVEGRYAPEKGYQWDVLADEETQACFKTRSSAEQYVRFVRGEVFSPQSKKPTGL